MHFSLIWRQHWKLVAAAGAPAAGFLAVAPVAAALVPASGIVLSAAGRLCRPEADGALPLREEALGSFGYLEAGWSSSPCENGE